MFVILKLLYEEIVKVNKSFYRDFRTSSLPLVGSPWPMFAILILYLFFIKFWGPNYLMRKRKPYNVKSLMQTYNLLQIFCNIYIFYNSFRYSYYQKHFNMSCQEYNVKDVSFSNMQLRSAAYVYYISKYLDLFDTIFFVLRKKYNQITFLHVYHHTAMVYAVWVYLTLLFASHYTMTGVINSFIHICMYSYYFVAALQLKVDLTPWKRRLTQLQILQFCYLTIHFVQPILNNWCGLDLFWTWLVFLQNLFMLALFCDFYYKTYLVKSQQVENVEKMWKSKEISTTTTTTTMANKII